MSHKRVIVSSSDDDDDILLTRPISPGLTDMDDTLLDDSTPPSLTLPAAPDQTLLVTVSNPPEQLLTSPATILAGMMAYLSDDDDIKEPTISTQTVAEYQREPSPARPPTTTEVKIGQQLKLKTTKRLGEKKHKKKKKAKKLKKEGKSRSHRRSSVPRSSLPNLKVTVPTATLPIVALSQLTTEQLNLAASNGQPTADQSAPAPTDDHPMDDQPTLPPTEDPTTPTPATTEPPAPPPTVALPKSKPISPVRPQRRFPSREVSEAAERAVEAICGPQANRACSTCHGKNFDTRSSLRAHARSHHVRYFCTCGYRTMTRDSVRRHQRIKERAGDERSHDGICAVSLDNIVEFVRKFWPHKVDSIIKIYGKNDQEASTAVKQMPPTLSLPVGYRIPKQSCHCSELEGRIARLEGVVARLRRALE